MYGVPTCNSHIGPSAGVLIGYPSGVESPGQALALLSEASSNFQCGPLSDGVLASRTLYAYLRNVTRVTRPAP